MIGEAEVLRPLVEECLDDDPAVRPTIVANCLWEDSNEQGYLYEGLTTKQLYLFVILEILLQQL